jgi:hypothetical protein
MISMGILTQEEADKHPAENKGAGEVTDADFPPKVVDYLTKGVQFAIKAPLPDETEGAMWVFKED